MCGITGFIRFTGDEHPSDAARLDRMVQTLHHRGPDEQGQILRNGVALGMRRLSIIDLSGGTQPIYNEDRSIATVFNGEIYNYPQLKKELEGRGHQFSTHSDTESIVHGYEEWGENFPARLNGMFGIALFDSKKRLVILVRDQMGIKPLYYCFLKDRLVFGSEIKALLASGWIDKKLRPDALADFLSWEYVPGEATLFEGIYKLRPAEMLVIDLARPTRNPRVYWEIASKESGLHLSAREWEERLLAQIRQSTRMQMLSDVPLGAFLSGGVDSSLIAACMGKVQTFSIGFDDPSYNELNWARKVARHLGVDHRDEIIRPDAVQLFDHLMQFMEDPIGDFSIFPTYLVSRLARQHVTVALSGDGGDELFAGYETYLAQEKYNLYQRVPSWLRHALIEPLAQALPPSAQKKGLRNKIRRFSQGAAYAESLSHTRWRLFVGDDLRSRLFAPDIAATLHQGAGAHIDALFAAAGNRGELNNSLYVDVKSYLCDNILTKVDRMSMAVSLETRVPYLDIDLVNLAFQIPESLKLERGQTKAILKKTAARLVPQECIYRPKEGFSIPIKHWLNNEFRPLVEEYLNEPAIRRDGLFHWPTIRRFIEEHRQGRENHSHILWSLIVFHDWQRRWLQPPPTH